MVSAAGQLVSFLPYGLASAQVDPMRSAARDGSWPARYIGSLLNAGGGLLVSGRTYEAGAPVARRVVIMTQPPVARVLYEATTKLPLALFSFPKLAPGNYLVLDCAFDNSRQALVYDWVVAEAA